MSFELYFVSISLSGRGTPLRPQQCWASWNCPHRRQGNGQPCHAWLCRLQALEWTRRMLRWAGGVDCCCFWQTETTQECRTWAQSHRETLPFWEGVPQVSSELHTSKTGETTAIPSQELIWNLLAQASDTDRAAFNFSQTFPWKPTVPQSLHHEQPGFMWATILIWIQFPGAAFMSLP